MAEQNEQPKETRPEWTPPQDRVKDSSLKETSKAPSETQPQSEKSSQTFDKDQLLMGLLADPQVQQVVKARQEGRQVRVSDDDEPQEKTTDKNFTLEDTLDEEIPDEVLPVIRAVESKLTGVLEPLTQRLSMLEDTASQYQKNLVDQQVATAKAKYPDFDQHRTTMAALARENPSLPIDELYLIARARSGNLHLAQTSTASEKPTAASRRGTRRDVSSKIMESARGSGRQAWNNSLADALDRTVG